METEVTIEGILDKKEAVEIYVKEIGIAIQKVIDTKNANDYYFSHNQNRIELLNKLHSFALEALKL